MPSFEATVTEGRLLRTRISLFAFMSICIAWFWTSLTRMHGMCVGTTAALARSPRHACPATAN